MNKYPLALLLVFLMAAPSRMNAQSRADSMSVVRKTAEQKTETFVDRDGDGIDDRATEWGKGLQRGKDRFIDRDGDGICDERSSGLGYRRRGMSGGSSAGAGQRGKGTRQGQGGKP